MVGEGGGSEGAAVRRPESSSSASYQTPQGLEGAIYCTLRNN